MQIINKVVKKWETLCESDTLYQYSLTFGSMKWHISFSQKYGKHLFFLWTITNSFKKAELWTMMNRQLNLILLKLNTFFLFKKYIFYSLKNKFYLYLILKNWKSNHSTALCKILIPTLSSHRLQGWLANFIFNLNSFFFYIAFKNFSAKIIVVKKAYFKKKLLKKYE